MKKIYLAGPISGLTYEGAQDWRDEFSASISAEIACFSPLRGKEYLKMRGPLVTRPVVQGLSHRLMVDLNGAHYRYFITDRFDTKGLSATRQTVDWIAW